MPGDPHAHHPRNAPRRLIRTFVLSTLIGLAATILSAWAFALLQTVDGASPNTGAGVEQATFIRPRAPGAGEGEGWITINTYRAVGAQFLQSYIQPEGGEGAQPPMAEVIKNRTPEGRLPAAALRDLYPPAGAWPGQDDNHTAMLDFRGWPFPALACTYTFETDASFKVVARPHAAIALPFIQQHKGDWAGAYPAALPLRPIWPGLLLNTALFTAAAWLLLVVPAALGRTTRRRRGQCPRCGYNRAGLTADAPCPECGDLFTRRS